MDHPTFWDSVRWYVALHKYLEHYHSLINRCDHASLCFCWHDSATKYGRGWFLDNSTDRSRAPIVTCWFTRFMRLSRHVGNVCSQCHDNGGAVPADTSSRELCCWWKRRFNNVDNATTWDPTHNTLYLTMGIPGKALVVVPFDAINVNPFSISVVHFVGGVFCVDRFECW
jgi:hypothetical protein